MSTLAPEHNGNGRAAGDDFYAPLLLTLEPDGTVTADFAGRVHADGLDLPTHEGDTAPTPHSMIQWLRESSGAVTATIHSVRSGSGEETLALTSLDVDGLEQAGLRLSGRSAHFTDAAVYAITHGGIAREIIDRAERSRFLQTFADATGSGSDNEAPVSWFLSFGIVNFDPPALAAGANALWSITGWTDVTGGGAGSWGPLVGDFVLHAAPRGLSNGLVIANAHADVTTNDEIRLNVRNVTGGAINQGPTDFVAAWVRGAGI